jgi:general secretion pathway protein G
MAQRSRSAAAGGFTLIEIMVVVTILGLLATFVITSATDNVDKAREQKAATDVRMLADAVRLYKAERGKLPALEDLTVRDAKGRRYVDSLPPDPWQHDYVLRADADPRDFEVVSGGPNQTLGDDDDISSRLSPQ